MKTIDQFMWGYQTHFRASVRYLANTVLERIGAAEETRALLIGVRRPDETAPHSVCVEPEDGDCPQSLFDGLLQEIEEAIPLDERQNMFFDDEPSMRDKPENIRRGVTREKIAERLRPYDAAHGVKSFCGAVYPIDRYYICPVVQVPETLVGRFRPIEFDFVDQWRPTRLSFLESCVWAVLDEANRALFAPEPGRGVRDSMRTADEVVALSAGNFMRGVSAIVGKFGEVDLLLAFNSVAALKYEGANASGRLVLASLDESKSAPEFLLRLTEPVRLNKSRWIRKLLQLASGSTSLVADAVAVLGIVSNPDELAANAERAFTVELPADRQWTLAYRSQQLLHVDAGKARLPTEPISYERFKDQVERLFGSSGDLDADALWRIFQTTLGLGRGHMVVIAEDAREEAARLSKQGTQIEPVPASNHLLEQACRIDGTVLVDVRGYCHAIGVILDGTAQPECTPSRGARYNSAVRYVADSSTARMAIVVSDDTTLDIVPLLRPRIEAAAIEHALAAYETATHDNYHLPRLFLDEHRFYLNPEQCERANAAIRRLDAMPKEVRVIYLGLDPFVPNPDMNESYLR